MPLCFPALALTGACMPCPCPWQAAAGLPARCMDPYRPLLGQSQTQWGVCDTCTPQPSNCLSWHMPAELAAGLSTLPLSSHRPVGCPLHHSLAPFLPRSKRAGHMEAVKREVEVLRRLRGCLNVAALEDVYEDDSHVHMVLEYCKGGELHHAIGETQYSGAWALLCVLWRCLAGRPVVGAAFVFPAACSSGQCCRREGMVLTSDGAVFPPVSVLDRRARVWASSCLGNAHAPWYYACSDYSVMCVIWGPETRKQAAECGASRCTYSLLTK